jgi:hypothetical protein
LRAHRVDPVEIGAGLEVPALAADDDSTQARRLLQRVKARKQRLNQLAVIGVVALRPVEHDPRHAAAVDVEENGAGCVCGHGRRYRFPPAWRSV